VESEAAAAGSDAIAADCTQRLNACHGQERCDLSSCVPETLQFSCVPRSDFMAESGNSTSGMVLTMFGSTKVGGEQMR
jgi:hypothetical protein